MNTATKLLKMQSLKPAIQAGFPGKQTKKKRNQKSTVKKQAELKLLIARLIRRIG